MNQSSSISDLNKIPHRMVVHTQDVVNITGLSARTCRGILQKIRVAFGKSKDAYVTYIEFCSYCQLNIEDVRNYLRY